jgi:hypothetical protein
MYEVIICTVSSGRVQRKGFDTWDEASRCANKWKDKGGYRVEMVRHELPVVRTVDRPTAVDEAA